MAIRLKRETMYKTIIIYALSLLLFTGCVQKSYDGSSEKLSILMEILQEEYIKDVNNTALTDKAIEAMVKTLDPHSNYLPTNKLEDFLAATMGEFGGIGISMGLQNSLLTVITPLLNSPAYKAGIRSGDTIIKINHHETLHLSLEECVTLTRGKVGTTLDLTIVRHGVSRPLLFRVKRETIETDVPTAKMLPDDILYLCLPAFTTKSAQQLQTLIKQYPSHKKIILDLRFNPGGILSQAIEIVDMFIDNGMIAFQKGRNSYYNETFHATKAGSDTQTPLAILINEGSASASEIVAGSLQVHRRATIIGQQSFGKGSVQTLFALDQQSALKLTIAKYYLPNGVSIHHVGVHPNIMVKNTYSVQRVKSSMTRQNVSMILKRLQTGALREMYVNENRQTVLSLALSSQDIYKDAQLRAAITFLKSSN